MGGIMNEEYIKISKAKNVLLKIADGIDPVSGKPIETTDFLKDERIKRCFVFVAEVLGRYIRGRESDERRFVITDEEKAKVVLPEGKIGTTQFIRCVNTYIDLTRSKKLTAVNLNKQLKKKGILGEKTTSKGGTRTVANENSINYGFETETRTYGNKTYDIILLNDDGKRYLLDNLQSIMDYKEEE